MILQALILQARIQVLEAQAHRLAIHVLVDRVHQVFM
jgi:hypothetical protein